MVRPLAAGFVLVLLAGLCGCGKQDSPPTEIPAAALSPEVAAQRARVGVLAAQWTREIDFTSAYSPSGVQLSTTQRPQFDPKAPFFGLPQTEGHELVFAACMACHETRLVMSQQQTEAQWRKTVDKMITKHGMAPLPEDLRARIAAYLGRHFGR